MPVNTFNPNQPWGTAEAHQRAADRLLRVCLLHGGLYVKLGQFVASMNHVLPPQYPETLARCQDRATPVRFESVRAAVEAELGLDALSDAFSHFEPTPSAAARAPASRASGSAATSGEVGETASIGIARAAAACRLGKP